MVELIPLLIQIVVGTIIVAPILWLVGRALVGKDKAKFLDAIWIVLLGTVINAVIGSFVSGLVGGLIAAVITLIVWLALIKHFFDCGWLMALVIAIIAVIVMFVIGIIVAFLTLGLLLLAL